MRVAPTASSAILSAREYFAETDETVNLKVKALVADGLGAIVCVGESLAIRDDDRYIEFVVAQVRAALAGLDAEDLAHVVVAYEPVWAIGTGRTATLSRLKKSARLSARPSPTCSQRKQLKRSAFSMVVP